MKKRVWFVIKLPNKKEFLYCARVTRWIELRDVVQYFNSTYDDDIDVVHVPWWKVLKKVFSGGNIIVDK